MHTVNHMLDGDAPEDWLIEAWNNCPVTERYVLDLAYTREPELVDEDLRERHGSAPR